MLDRLGPPAQRAADQARREASALRHDHIGTEHLLLGIVAVGDSAAGRVLAAHGVTAAALRSKVVEAVPPGEAPIAELALSDRASRALDRARRLSLRHGESAVGTVAMAVSVIDVEGTAGQVLRGLGADIPALRADLLATADDGTPDAFAPAGPAPTLSVVATADEGPPPTCGRCGAALIGSLRMTRTVARDVKGVDHPVTVVACATCGVAIGVAPAGDRQPFG